MIIKTEIFKKINKRILYFGVLFLLLAIFEILQYQESIAIPEYLRKILHIVFVIVATIAVINIILRIAFLKISNLLDDTEMEIERRLFLTKVYTWTTYLLGLLIVLWQFGVSIENITLIIGFAATGFAFAIREVILSHLVWLMLLTKKPFRIGDYIKVGENEGRVVHIGTFYVMIDESPESSDDYVRIPNKMFLEQSIENFGKKEMMIHLNYSLEEIKSEKIKLIKNRLKRELPHAQILLDIKDEKPILSVRIKAPIPDKDIIRDRIVKIMLEDVV